MTELVQWKDIKGYEGIYQASDSGMIKSLARVDKFNRKQGGTILSGCLRRSGYVYVNLWKNGKCKSFDVHRIIAKTFLDSIEGKDVVNHKNGNKADNRLGNLEWVTDKENKQHAINVLGVKYGGHHGRIYQGDNAHHRKVSEKDVYEIKKLLHEGNLLQREIAEKFGITQSNVSAINLGKAWIHVIYP